MMKWRISLKGLVGCCGSSSAVRDTTTATTLPTISQQHQQHEQEAEEEVTNDRIAKYSLAMALAAERNKPTITITSAATTTPTCVRRAAAKTLMTLIKEIEEVDFTMTTSNQYSKNKKKRKVSGNKEGDDEWVCCVCMERTKGAAFIPCGHSFCRSCATNLWTHRGSCPVCNVSVLDILTLY